MKIARATMISASIFFTAFLWLYGSFHTTKNIVEYMKPPERPATVPESAVWCHRPGCQVWINCEALPDTDNRFRCTIYTAQTGEIVGSGVYRLYGEPTTVEQLHSLFLLYDGYSLILKDGRELVPDHLYGLEP